jgi:sugar phosphate isomerase/epimerase
MEYDICVGFHNHPRKLKDPAYKMWDPIHILGLVQGRDQRIGSAADVGHWVRSGLDPVDCLKLLKGRVVSAHLKDLNAKAPEAHDVPFGNGVTGIPAVIAELKRQKFSGNASIEYEFNWKNNVTDVAQCVGFIRGLAAK